MRRGYGRYRIRSKCLGTWIGHIGTSPVREMMIALAALRWRDHSGERGLVLWTPQETLLDQNIRMSIPASRRSL